jgi:hypothetical protein
MDRANTIYPAVLTTSFQKHLHYHSLFGLVPKLYMKSVILVPKVYQNPSIKSLNILIAGTKLMDFIYFRIYLIYLHSLGTKLMAYLRKLRKYWFMSRIANKLNLIFCQVWWLEIFFSYKLVRFGVLFCWGLVFFLVRYFVFLFF